MQAVSDAVPDAVLDAVPEVVSVDGKTLRRSFDAASKQSPIHMVHAWAGENRLILGQLTVADRSNEIPAVRQLLGTLNLEGATVTADAMHCQRETASQILEQGGDYWLAVKGNQGTLHEDLKAYWGENGAVPGSVMHRTVDAGHGRIETRTVRVCNQVEGIQHDHDWPGLKAVAMVSSVREFKAAHDDRPLSQSVRYCIMSHDRSARTTAAIVRSHWGVENQLHWVLDVVFNEDQSRNRCDNAPANLSLMRKFALNTLRKEPSTISVRRKRLKAARNHDYLRTLLTLGI